MLRDESVGFEATWCSVEREAGHDAKCERLHRRLKRIGKARAALDAQEAEALREAERLRMWRHYGYGSLIEYMEIELGYTPRMGLDKLRVAKAIAELPVIADALAQGDLSFSAGRELVRVATPETEGQWLEAASDKNVRDVESLVSGHKRGDTPTDPVDPALRTRTLRFDGIDDETRALLRQARQILERQRGERVDDCALLRTFARMVVDGAASPERTRAPYQIAVTLCEQCKRGWQDGGGITVPMSPATVEVALCDAVHIGSVANVIAARSSSRDKHGAASKQSTGASAAGASSTGASSTGASSAGASSAGASSAGASSAGASSAGARPAGASSAFETPTPRATSDIPPARRRRVLARDHARCRVPWCRSSRNIDVHHLLPRAEGGDHCEENLLCLCESHHIAQHSGSLIITGTATNATITRRAHNSFALAERAVETTSALKSLGFNKHEVKLAIERTRAHVGTAELSLEQWIRIALSYCPKPT